jgi:hypothetical protein
METSTNKKKQSGKDTATHRYYIRLNSEENARFKTLFLQSGMKDKTGFFKNMIFSHVMKTVKIDKAAIDYYIRLTDEQFSQLAKDYMEKMNYGSQPYIVYIHEDIDRRHIHIVSVCVDEAGRKIDDSFEHRRSMTACRELEIRYGLRQIGDEKKEADKLFLKKVDFQKGNIKHQVANILKNVSDYRFRTFGEYSALLSCFNIEAKLIRGEGTDGKPFNGILYSATDDSGKVVSTPFKSSLFGKPFGYERLNRQMEKNEKALKEGKYAPMIRGDIASAMKAAHSKDEFLKILQSRGIDAIFRTNDAGRLYGTTFIDHNRKEVYNGSALGKDFSANVFHRLFNETTSENHSNTVTVTGENHSPASSQNKENALEQIFGIFDFPISDSSTGDDMAEQDLVRRLKKKKKQRHL